jgi:hypothetical protein
VFVGKLFQNISQFRIARLKPVAFGGQSFMGVNALDDEFGLTHKHVHRNYNV